MSGLIGIPCNESARFSETYASIMGMHLPPDWTVISPQKSRIPAMQVRFASLAASLNLIGQVFIDSPAEWLFLLNDDHIYPPDTLLKLLAHKKDFVTGIYLKKQYPFDPILYDRFNENGQMVGKTFVDGERGLVPIVGCGDGVLLIHRRVMEKIPYPWWEMSSPESPDLITQDLIFCKKVREAGFEMWADLDCLIGHIAIVPVFPRNADGKWTTVLISGQNDHIELPAAKPKESGVLTTRE